MQHSNVIASTPLPSPPRLPWIGHVLSMKPDRLHTKLQSWQKQLGPLYTLKVFQDTLYVFSDPEIIDEILNRRPQRFRRMAPIRNVLSELGLDGVFSAEAQEWRHQRRMINPGFSKRNIEKIYPIMGQITEHFKEKLNSDAASNTSINMQKTLMHYSVDIAHVLSFGQNPETIFGRHNHVQEHLEILMPELNRRIQSPIPYWRFIKTPADRRLEKSVDRIVFHLSQLVTQAEQDLATGEPPAIESILHNILLESKRLEEKKLSHSVLVSNLFTLLLGGEDTTANSLAWTLYHLANHPQYLEKILLELGEFAHGQTYPHLDEWPQFPMLDAVIKESMRLNPVAPLLFMENSGEETLCGVSLKADTKIILNLGAVYRDPKNFYDPDSFIPERWLETFVNKSHHSQYFWPFGGGARICPAHNFALLEMKLAMTMMIRSFRWELTEDKVQDKFFFASGPENLQLKLMRRLT